MNTKNIEAIFTNDAVINSATGQGTVQDKATYGQFARRQISGDECMAIYRSDGIGRKIVDLPIEDMLSNWRIWDVDTADTIEKCEDELDYVEVVREGLLNADIFGGSVIVMFIKGQDDLTKPLNIDSVGVGDLVKIVSFDRWLVGKLNINFYDVMADNYLRPELYQLLGPNNSSVQVHYSRVIELEGLSLPLYEKRHSLMELWGDSRYNQLYDALLAFNSEHSAVQTLVSEANVDVISVDGLGEVTTSEIASDFERRMELVKLGKSNYNVMIKDTDEEYDRKSVSFSNLDKLLEMTQINLSAVSNIPMTKLFGQSAKGMNATGDGDIHDYHEWLEARQAKLGRSIRHLDEVLCRSAGYNGELDYNWVPMVVESTDIKVKNLLTLGQAYNAFNGVILPAEVREFLSEDGLLNIDESVVIEPLVEESDDESNAR